MRARPALVGVAVLAVVVYGGLAALATTPRIFYDELLYIEVADSLGAGDGLEFRGSQYERGPLYPVLLAPLLAAAPDREVGYLLAKLLNAILSRSPRSPSICSHGGCSRRGRASPSPHSPSQSRRPSTSRS